MLSSCYKILLVTQYMCPVCYQTTRSNESLRYHSLVLPNSQLHHIMLGTPAVLPKVSRIAEALAIPAYSFFRAVVQALDILWKRNIGTYVRTCMQESSVISTIAYILHTNCMHELCIDCMHLCENTLHTSWKSGQIMDPINCFEPDLCVIVNYKRW